MISSPSSIFLIIIILLFTSRTSLVCSIQAHHFSFNQQQQQQQQQQQSKWFTDYQEANRLIESIVPILFLPKKLINRDYFRFTTASSMVNKIPTIKTTTRKPLLFNIDSASLQPIITTTIPPPPPLINRTINGSTIESKMNLLNDVHRNAIDLFNKIEGKLEDNQLGREMIVQFKRRCFDKIKTLQFLLPNLQRKLDEKRDYLLMMNTFGRLIELRKNETESLVHDIGNVAADLSDSISLELSRLMDTLFQRDYDDLRKQFAWQNVLSSLVNSELLN